MSNVGMITGAAGGVGQVTAERFARDGWDLVLADVADQVKNVAAQVAFEEMKKIECDKIPLGQAADLAELASAIAFFGSVDGTISSAPPWT